MLSPGNFLPGGGLQRRDGKETFYEGDFPPEFLLDEGDLLIAMTDLKQDAPILGSTIRVPESNCYLHNQRLGLVTDVDERVDSGFLYYLLNSDVVRSWLRATATGSTVRHTAPERIYAAEVRIPPFKEQVKIAASLEALDHLLENNRRRVEIVEEMARLIYREWFVHFRFPGHEDVEMVNSALGAIPDGWSVEPIGQVVDVVGGGTPSRKVEEYWNDGTIEWFTPSDLTKQSAMYAFGSADRISELGLRKSSAKLFPERTVMMTSRATIGEIAVATTPATTNQGFISCVPNGRLSEYHLYFWLRANVDYFETLAGGATFKELRKSTFRELPVAVPQPEVEAAFNRTVGPLCDLVENLLRQTKVLREARNLLLPRLVSGELDVSELDLEFAEVG